MAAHLAIRGKPRRWGARVNHEVKPLAAVRALNGFADFHVAFAIVVLPITSNYATIRDLNVLVGSAAQIIHSALNTFVFRDRLFIANGPLQIVSHLVLCLARACYRLGFILSSAFGRFSPVGLLRGL